ncbi:ABC transporter ATP-binding protein [Thiorhodococcus fuscus]|uniref:ABC transporter ATP-binding protein n=1 Tax=Thiorhodococcus fuscus TaxID=527200 RepID=A0ABW4YBZ8_9GAMM
MPELTDSYPYLPLVSIADLWWTRGVALASEEHFGQILVTGPPGSGKSTLIGQLGGWPEEGYIDLTLNGWWRARSLALRPRELHLGLPFVGQRQALSLFDAAWLEQWRALRLDENRILLPPPKRHFFSTEWRHRFVFEFLLPPPQAIVADRTERARLGTHPIDRIIDPEQIAAQVRLYAQVALHFHRGGMIVHLRERAEDPPLRIDDHGTTEPHLP